MYGFNRVDWFKIWIEWYWWISHSWYFWDWDWKVNEYISRDIYLWYDIVEVLIKMVKIKT